MDEEWRKLISDVIEAHPGPWEQANGWRDNGSRFWSIKDANRNDVFDGETGRLSEPVAELLLNFPELAKDVLYPNTGGAGG